MNKADRESRFNGFFGSISAKFRCGAMFEVSTTKKEESFSDGTTSLSFWVKMVLHVVLPRENFEIEANEVGWLAVFNVNVN